VCLGALYLASEKYYPNRAGDIEDCLQDWGPTFAPEYMAQFGTWFPETLEACCKRHYHHDLSAYARVKPLSGPTSGMLTITLGNASSFVLDLTTEE
jgi:adenine-specific DNA methylase